MRLYMINKIKKKHIIIYITISTVVLFWIAALFTILDKHTFDNVVVMATCFMMLITLYIDLLVNWSSVAGIWSIVYIISYIVSKEVMCGLTNNEICGDTCGIFGAVMITSLIIGNSPRKEIK